MIGWDQGDKSLRVLWNGGTQVYVRASPGWAGQLQGLCGDYNQNPKDDYKLQVRTFFWNLGTLIRLIIDFLWVFVYTTGLEYDCELLYFRINYYWFLFNFNKLTIFAERTYRTNCVSVCQLLENVRGMCRCWKERTDAVREKPAPKIFCRDHVWVRTHTLFIIDVLTPCLLFTYSHCTHTVFYYSFVSVCWLILLLNSKYSILLDIFIVSVLLLNVPILISKYHLQNEHQKRLLKLKARVSQEYLNCPN